MGETTKSPTFSCEKRERQEEEEEEEIKRGRGEKRQERWCSLPRLLPCAPLLQIFCGVLGVREMCHVMVERERVCVWWRGSRAEGDVGVFTCRGSFRLFLSLATFSLEESAKQLSDK